jgi:hypothetical protein
MDSQANLVSGFITFDAVHEYGQGIPDPPGPMDKVSRSHYKKLCNQQTARIPEIPGWYAWIGFSGRDVTIIYVGQSRLGPSANLRKRIAEELADELIAIWATKHGEQQIMPILDRKYEGRYTMELARSVRKVGVTFIIWIGQKGLLQQELDDVENTFIERLHPTANKKRLPTQHLFTDLADKAEKALRGVILEIIQKQTA